MVKRRQRGFTLTELVMIIIVMGILAVVVVPQFNALDTAKAGYFNEVAAAARHAQKLAVASGCSVRLQVDSTRYALIQETPCNSASYSLDVCHPGQGSTYARAVPNGVSLSGSNIDFYADGSSSGGSVTVDGRSFTVHTTTGYVDEG